jgi:cytosine/adenosine deaminase-related metal-dependent hydrolase
MRYLTADIVFTGLSSPLKHGVIVLNNDGIIEEVLPHRTMFQSHQLEYYEGALCPGFINTHCHLELSHLNQQLNKKKGLPEFIHQLIELRQMPIEIIVEAIEQADRMMFQNGIVAVGDISNTSNTFAIKQNSSIFYHTFIELYSSDPSCAESVFQSGLELAKQCQTSCSISPHANYSLSLELFDLIKKQNSGQILSIHNQETPTEDEMFISGTGQLMSQLMAKDFFVPTGKTALQSVLPLLPNSPLLLVHNTFTTIQDIHFALSQHKKLYWCTCPKANLFIENSLPNYQQFIETKAQMTIGTDSLASNDTLSILEEMKIIQPYVSLELLVQWACKNGAEFLGLNKFGSFQKGKSPGVNHITNIVDGKLSVNSQVFPLC